ncbi:hypothetical protein ES703_91768 [subsurface metagenome]
MMRIEIPYVPPVEYSLNWRGAWPQRYQAGRVYGLAVFYICVDYRNRLGNEFIQIQIARLDLTMVYAVERVRDRDNIISMFKPGLDAVVRAGLIAGDDSKRLHWGDVNIEVDRDRAPLTIIELKEEESGT